MSHTEDSDSVDTESYFDSSNNTNGETVTAFLNGITGVENRNPYQATTLETRADPENESVVQLVSYQSHIVAERNTESGEVTIHEGHIGIHSRTTDRHTKLARRKAESAVSDRQLFKAPTSPQAGRVKDSIKYADNYVGGFTDTFSPVERDAVNEVNDILSN